MEASPRRGVVEGETWRKGSLVGDDVCTKCRYDGDWSLQREAIPMHKHELFQRAHNVHGFV